MAAPYSTVPISGYNSNVTWAVRAKHDLKIFNARHKTNLNPLNYEDLRVFFLRAALNDRDQVKYFGSADPKVTGRSVGTFKNKGNTLINLAYMENVVPRQSERTKTILKQSVCYLSPNLPVCKGN
ncbi:MAG: hypothetical protein V4692_14700 [Bdellovibrionota bacterium]